MDPVPTLVDMVIDAAVDIESTDALPAAALALMHRCDSLRIVIPTSATVLHQYPVDAEESFALRRAFEISTCLPGVDYQHDVVIDLNLPWRVNDATWHLLTVVPAEVRRRLGSLSEQFTVDRCCVSVAADAAAAAMARFAVGNTVLVGRRNNRWEAIGIEADGSIGHVFLRFDEPRFDTSVVVRDILLDIRASTERSIDRCLIYGDGLSKAEFDDIGRAVTDLVGGVGRCNPFRAVMAETSDDVKRTCLRLAHVLGPIVGLLSPTPTALNIPLPCESLAAS